MVTWLEAIGPLARERNIVLADLKQCEEYLPAAFADFDTETRMGRISVWAHGLIDIEVLGVEEGKQVHFEHVEVEELSKTELAAAVERFLDAMAGA